MEGHGWSFPITGLTFQVRKVIGGRGGVACRVILSDFIRFEGELIWAGLDWRGPDIGSGLVNCQAQVQVLRPKLNVY